MSAKQPKQEIKLTAAQQAELLLMYETGRYSLQELADRFDISKTTAHRIVKSSNMGDHSVEAPAAPSAEAIKKQLQERQLQQANEIANRVLETNETHYKLSSYLANLIGVEFQAVGVGKKTLSDIGQGMKAAQAAAKAIETIRKERYALLGLDVEKDEDDSLPELVIRQLTPEQVDTMRKAADEGGLNVDLSDLDEIPDATIPGCELEELDEIGGVVDTGSLDLDGVIEEGGDA